MTWVAWRQQRYVFWAFALAGAALIAWAVLSGLRVETLLHRYLAPPCLGGNGFPVRFNHFCIGAADDVNRAKNVNYWIAAAAYVLPVALGVVLGVGTVASEIDRKTARLAWTQSVTRTRWLVVKVLVALASMSLIMIPLCITISWWVRASQYASRMSGNGFSESGWGLGAICLFAFALAVVLGVLIRQPGWTAAAAAILFLVATTMMTSYVRLHLVPLRAATVTNSVITKGGFTTSVSYGGAPEGSWSVYQGFIPLHSTTVPSGADAKRTFARLSACEQSVTGAAPHRERACLERLGLRDADLYISDREFWTLQMREGGLYLGASALLLGLSAAALRRIRA